MWQKQFLEQCTAVCHTSQEAMRKDQINQLRMGIVRRHLLCFKN